MENNNNAGANGDNIFVQGAGEIIFAPQPAAPELAGGRIILELSHATLSCMAGAEQSINVQPDNNSIYDFRVTNNPSSPSSTTYTARTIKFHIGKVVQSPDFPQGILKIAPIVKESTIKIDIIEANVIIDLEDISFLEHMIAHPQNLKFGKDCNTNKFLLESLWDFAEEKNITEDGHIILSFSGDLSHTVSDIE